MIWLSLRHFLPENNGIRKIFTKRELTGIRDTTIYCQYISKQNILKIE
jgi:hypothetical protein